MLDETFRVTCCRDEIFVYKKCSFTMLVMRFSISRIRDCLRQWNVCPVYLLISYSLRRIAWLLRIALNSSSYVATFHMTRSSGACVVSLHPTDDVHRENSISSSLYARRIYFSVGPPLHFTHLQGHVARTASRSTSYEIFNSDRERRSVCWKPISDRETNAFGLCR